MLFAGRCSALACIAHKSLKILVRRARTNLGCAENSTAFWREEKMFTFRFNSLRPLLDELFLTRNEPRRFLKRVIFAGYTFNS